MRINYGLKLFLASFCGGLCVGFSVFAQDVAIANAKVYLSPDKPASTHTTVLIRHGKIAAVGRNPRVPNGIRIIECKGCTVFPGFWNTHVHFTGQQWVGADLLSADELTRSMQAMLTHSGFTTVVDLASDPANTTALRRRVNSGEVAGPMIYTAGFGLFPPGGVPYYLDDLPASLLRMLPQPAIPEAAVAVVRNNQAQGANVVKLFTGSFLTPENIVHMPEGIAQAAALQGHREHQLVFAHPSDLQGVRIALDSGVDVLAHAPDVPASESEALVNTMVSHHMAMIPTLKLFFGNGSITRMRNSVLQFRQAGGQLLFGTDTGFLTDYDVTEEFHQLGLAGLSFRDVFAMLTANPAKEFHLYPRVGTIERGSDGDLTVLSADPNTGRLENFASICYTIRGGKILFESTPKC